MPASKVNFIAFHDNDPQIYGSANKDIVLSTPPPEGSTLEERHVFFITYQPDTKELTIHPLPKEEVRNAELRSKKPKKKDN